MDCYGGMNGYVDYRHHNGMIGSNNGNSTVNPYHSHHMPNYSPSSSHMHNYHSYNYHQSTKMHQPQAPNFRYNDNDSNTLACDRFGYGNNVNGMTYSNNNNYGNATHNYTGPMESRSYSQHHYPPSYETYNPVANNYPQPMPPPTPTPTPSTQPPQNTQFPYPSRDYHGYDHPAYKTRIGAENYMSRDSSYQHHHNHLNHHHQPSSLSAAPYMNNDYYGTHSNSMNPMNGTGNEHYPPTMPYRSMHPSNNFPSDYHKNLPLTNQYANDANGFSSNLESGNQIFM